MIFTKEVHLNSLLQRWGTKSKVLGFLSLIFAFSFVKNLLLLPVMLGVTLVLYRLSNLSLSEWVSHLRYPSLFLLGIVGFLPFAAGETILGQWGAIALRWEGLQDAILISGRFLCIATLGSILAKTTPILDAIAALQSLGLPPILADMTLLSYRYLFEIDERWTAMQKAMQLRGFRDRKPARKLLRLDRAELQGTVILAGTLLIRSYEQSERVYRAMRLRGYGFRPPVRVKSSWREGWGSRRSKIGAIAMVLLASSFVAANSLLQNYRPVANANRSNASQQARMGLNCLISRNSRCSRTL